MDSHPDVSDDLSHHSNDHPYKLTAIVTIEKHTKAYITIHFDLNEKFLRDGLKKKLVDFPTHRQKNSVFSSDFGMGEHKGDKGLFIAQNHHFL